MSGAACIHQSVPFVIAPSQGAFVFRLHNKPLQSPGFASMPHHHYEGRRISARTPLFDHAGQQLGWYPPADVLRLLERRDVVVRASRKRILAVHFLAPDPALLELSGSKRRRPMGYPHQHENYFNPPGCWHLDRIPAALKPLFGMSVLVAIAI